MTPQNTAVHGSWAAIRPLIAAERTVIGGRRRGCSSLPVPVRHGSGVDVAGAADPAPALFSRARPDSSRRRVQDRLGRYSHQGISVAGEATHAKLSWRIIHPQSVEIYQIVEGGATLVTGRTLTLPLYDSPPDLIRSTAIADGQQVTESTRPGEDATERCCCGLARTFQI
jgi:hypothetical protein